MNTIDDRKKGFEAKYQKDQEAQFKIRSIRNRLIGKWAAELLQPLNKDEYPHFLYIFSLFYLIIMLYFTWFINFLGHEINTRQQPL